MQGVIQKSFQDKKQLLVYPIFDEILEELKRADGKYEDDPMSMEELKKSFLTIKSELVELEREVERKNLCLPKMKKEAIQVAAMAIKFIRDVVEPEKMLLNRKK